MKNYPRIYSLSTVGLIHHREFDYLFNAFRTDFIGESGSGKSMIADLIQLILVGSDAFESSTKSNEVRDPAGMVLITQNQSKGIGYAFLNIEIGPQKYLPVGVYIESGVRSTQAFIIQAGYKWNEIEYLGSPLSYKQLLINGEIANTDMLKQHLDNQHLHIQFWQRLKEFHRILYRERIVPLDLASSDRLLKDYAGILQSFSRGKTLDTQKSDSLKQFLFGDVEAKRIMENFRKAEKDMGNAIDEYGRNLQEIERVTQKQRELLELRDLKQKMDAAREALLLKNLLYSFQQRSVVEKEIKDIVLQFLSASQHQRVLIEILSLEQTKIAQQLPSLYEKKKEAEETWREIAGDHDQFLKVSKLLSQLNCTLDELQIKYNQYKIDQAQYYAYTTFADALRSKNLLELFDALPTKESFSQLKDHISSVVTELEQRLFQKTRLQQYSNIDDPHSLTYWALQQKRRLSHEQESAIVHFQTLPRTKQEDHSDYLPHPSDLILSLNFAEKEEKGFWIILNGIHSFIAYVKDRILDTDDERVIRSYFENYTHTLKEDITSIKWQLSQYQSIVKVMDEQTNPILAIQGYRRKEELRYFKPSETLEFSPERLSEYRKIYNRRDAIQEEYQQAKNRKTLIEEEGRELERQERDCANALTNLSTPAIAPAVQAIIDQERLALSFPDFYQQEKENVFTQLSRQENKSSYARTESFSINKAYQNGSLLPKLKVDLGTYVEDLEKHKKQFLRFYNELPELLVSTEYIDDPSKIEGPSYIKAEMAYNTHYQSIIKQFIPSEDYQLGIDKDFVAMAKSLLPEAFQGTVLNDSDNDIVDTVSSYLIRINEKNRQLNNRKIQKIRDLLDEVDEITTQQENTIRRIDNFLHRSAQITGGYTARLHRKASLNFPKQWIVRFKDELEDNHSGSLGNRLGEKISLDEMMLAAFYNCGGSISSRATIAKLLDPSSYYDLSFSMESESGRVNKGSTGQTYAAISLLCIARLSIMSSDENKAIEPAVRIMPIDEAEGLGSNYDMLYDIAKRYDYQLLSLSIGPVGRFKDGEQYLYMLHKNMEVDEPINYTPVAILSEADKNPASTTV